MASPPTVLLGPKRDVFLQALAEGYSPPAACERAGVVYKTYRDWMLKGGNPGGDARHACPPHLQWEPYYSFARDVRAAQATGRQHDQLGSLSGAKPAALSETQQDALCHALAHGFTYHAAAHLAGVRLSTFVSWLRRGGYPRQLSFAKPLLPAFIADPYATFVRRILAAEDSFFAARETEAAL